MSATVTKPAAKRKTAPYKSRSYCSALEAIPSGTNVGLTSPRNRFMLELLGEPRKNMDYTQDDKGLDNARLSRLHASDQVGPFRVTGLTLAVQSLKIILLEIKRQYPEIYETLGTAGMSSVRLQRSKEPTKAISNHSWGTAIDLKVDGLLDPWRDDKTQQALAVVCPIFNKHCWYWGGSYKPKKDKSGTLHSREDAMHFEISKEMLLECAALGYLGSNSQRVANANETRKLMGRKNPAESTRKNRAQFTARVLVRPTKPSTPPLVSKPLPSSNMFRRPIPRRPTESFPHWLGRTATSWAKSPSSWFR